MFFERNLYTDLVAWKQGKYRKPLIVQGARQVGKTSLIRHFGKTQFASIAYFNFDERPELNQIFQQTKQVDRILNNPPSIARILRVMTINRLPSYT
jgi:uncharacterized protein